MSRLEITVGGAPVPKGRPRARIAYKRNGEQFIAFYTPKETAKYERDVRVAAQLARADAGLPIFNEAVAVEITAFIPIPKSFSAKKTDQAMVGLVKPATRPDCDNYLKAALDALNGIVFTDDARVTDLVVRKRYALEPRLEIVVEPAPTPLEEHCREEAA